MQVKKTLFACVLFLGLCSSLFAAGPSAVTADPKQNPAKNAAQDEYTAETSMAINTAQQKDPYEKYNRGMTKINEVIDHFVLKPIATLYIKLIPKPMVKGISNFYTNVDTVPTVLNDLLQGNFYQATSDGWRLTINSTAGVLGFLDFATDMGLEPNTEDFGLTLARWGYTNSNYFVLPFLGPSTIRDGIGWPINYYFLTIYPYIYPVRERYEIYGMGIVSRRADLLHFQSVFEQAAVDHYVFLRDAYLQRRNYLIQRNKELGNPYANKEDGVSRPVNGNELLEAGRKIPLPQKSLAQKTSDIHDNNSTH